MTYGRRDISAQPSTTSVFNLTVAIIRKGELYYAWITVWHNLVGPARLSVDMNIDGLNI